MTPPWHQTYKKEHTHLKKKKGFCEEKFLEERREIQSRQKENKSPVGAWIQVLQIHLCLNSWKLWMLPFIAKAILQMWLNLRSWEGEIILDYLDRPNVIMRALIKGTYEESESEKRAMQWQVQRLERDNLKEEERAQAKESRQPVNAGNCRATDAPFRIFWKNQLCRYFWFWPHETQSSRLYKNKFV